MCSPKAPQPTPPTQTAAASTSTNVGTAVANAMLGNVNQNTPYGSLNYSQTGTYQWNDPYTGESYDIPQFTATQTLSPQGQQTQNNLDQAQGNLSSIAADRSAFLKDYFKQGVDTSKIPGLIGNLGLQTTLGSGYNSTFSPTIGGSYTTSAPELATSYAGADDFSADRQRVEDALWQRGAADRASQEEALRTRLLNSGIREGSVAWNSEMQRLAAQNTDARLATTAAAGQEQSRLVGLARDAAQFGNDYSLAGAQFGNQASLDAAQFGSSQQQAGNAATLDAAQFGNNAALQNATFQNQARSQGMQEAYNERNQPLNEILALMGGSQVQQPNFVNTNMPTIPTTDVAGIIGNADQQKMSAWQQQQQQQSALLGNLIGGGAFLGSRLSDDDAKKDKERIGDVEGPMGLWAYHYKGEPKGAPKRLGLMASEVEKVRPEAVKRGADGLRRVNYGKALGLMGA